MQIPNGVVVAFVTYYPVYGRRCAMAQITTKIDGKKYEVTDGGCWDCAFLNKDECEYTAEIGGVKRSLCKLKFGKHYEEARDAD
jgi:hypothetical protein